MMNKKKKNETMLKYTKAFIFSLLIFSLFFWHQIDFNVRNTTWDLSTQKTY